MKSLLTISLHKQTPINKKATPYMTTNKSNFTYMKKIILTIMCFYTFSSIAQTNKLKVNENAKSGNFKDLITSFYQLTTKDLTGDEKSLAFNASLFAIKSKADPSLLIDKNYINEGFSRNFQFTFKVNLDKVYKYNGFTGGIKYAIINNRDSTMVNFVNTDLDTQYSYLSGLIYDEQKRIIKSIIKDDSIDISKEINSLQDAVNEILDNKNLSLNAKEGTYTKQILDNINQQIATKNYVDAKSNKISNRNELLSNLNNLANNYYKELQSKGLFVLEADGSADEIGKFNKASFGLNYLKGNKEAWNEIDLRTKLIYADTLQTEHLPRLNFNAKAGWNLKFGGNSNNQNNFEIKAALEYNKILRNILPDEKKESFFANADFRFRISDNLWIPITVKYDIEKSNFLGFLNVTYNFENL